MLDLSNFSYTSSYFVFILPAMLLSLYAQMKITSSFGKYSQVSSDTNYSGAQVARIILDRNGLGDVAIKQVPGKLTDHYDPRTRTISLSPSVYGDNSIASLSVAAHEVGHAMQHAENYIPLKLRSAIAPIASFGSRLVWIFIMVGFLISPILIEVGILMFISVVIFQLITLPVEFNASRRALAQLEDGIMPRENIQGSRKVLSAAALTYIAATLAAIGQLLRLLVITDNRRRD